jgi:hypothetical protein
MSVDETLMCSFQILKPAERKTKFTASNKMWNYKLFPLPEATEVSYPSYVILPYSVSIGAMVWSNSCTQVTVETRFYSVTDWFSVIPVTVSLFTSDTSKILVVHHLGLELRKAFEYRLLVFIKDVWKLGIWNRLLAFSLGVFCTIAVSIP